MLCAQFKQTYTKIRTTMHYNALHMSHCICYWAVGGGTFGWVGSSGAKLLKTENAPVSCTICEVSIHHRSWKNLTTGVHRVRPSSQGHQGTVRNHCGFGDDVLSESALEDPRDLVEQLAFLLVFNHSISGSAWSLGFDFPRISLDTTKEKEKTSSVISFYC